MTQRTIEYGKKRLLSVEAMDIPDGTKVVVCSKCGTSNEVENFEILEVGVARDAETMVEFQLTPWKRKKVVGLIKKQLEATFCKKCSADI